MAKKSGSQLQIYYIDFSNQSNGDEANGGKNSGFSVAPMLVGIGNPMAVTALTVKGVTGAINYAVDAAKNNIPSVVQAITDPETLKQFENPLGNRWVIKQNPNEIPTQFYIRHPKTYYSNYLIEASEFNKYVYDEYCKELINYCCSHCPAKKIAIYRIKEKSGKTGGGYKKISADASFDSRREEVYCISSKTKLKTAKKLKEYVWLEPGLMEGVDNLSEDSSLHWDTYQDFKFGTSASVLKKVEANLKYAQSYKFTIDIKT